jgi:hypothetical protein
LTDDHTVHSNRASFKAFLKLVRELSVLEGVVAKTRHASSCQKRVLATSEIQFFCRRQLQPLIGSCIGLCLSILGPPEHVEMHRGILNALATRAATAWYCVLISGVSAPTPDQTGNPIPSSDSRSLPAVMESSTCCLDPPSWSLAKVSLFSSFAIPPHRLHFVLLDPPATRVHITHFVLRRCILLLSS